jgi:hypothetical protein
VATKVLRYSYKVDHNDRGFPRGATKDEISNKKADSAGRTRANSIR